MDSRTDWGSYMYACVSIEHTLSSTILNFSLINSLCISMYMISHHIQGYKDAVSGKLYDIICFLDNRLLVGVKLTW